MILPIWFHILWSCQAFVGLLLLISTLRSHQYRVWSGLTLIAISNLLLFCCGWPLCVQTIYGTFGIQAPYPIYWYVYWICKFLITCSYILLGVNVAHNLPAGSLFPRRVRQHIIAIAALCGLLAWGLSSEAKSQQPMMTWWALNSAADWAWLAMFATCCAGVWVSGWAHTNAGVRITAWMLVQSLTSLCVDFLYKHTNPSHRAATNGLSMGIAALVSLMWAKTIQSPQASTEFSSPVELPLVPKIEKDGTYA